MTKKPVVPGFQGKRRTALESIRRFCLACMGGSAPLVAECASPACAFHGHRMGVIEQGADRRLVRVIAGYCREQCQPGEDPAACAAGKVFMDLEPCACWPFRTGKNPYISAEQREKQRQRAQEQYQLAGGEARFRPRIIETPAP